MNKVPVKRYQIMKRRYPDVMAAVEQLGTVTTGAGPLDDKVKQLVQLGAAAALRSEGAVHSHSRRALEAGASAAEIHHALLLLTSTIGFPTVVAAITWADDVIDGVVEKRAPLEAARGIAGMLVTFRTKAHADITMFGNVATDLLKLAGMTGAVPTAILAGDIPSVIARLEGGLAQRKAMVPEDSVVRAAGGTRDPAKYDPEAEPAVPLGHRALPLLALLRDAEAAGADVIVSASR